MDTGIIRSSKRTVLIVEDEVINQILLGHILEERYNVLYAGNGQEAMEILHDGIHQIAMILLDINMPVMDGFEFLRLASKDELVHTIPIIVLTGDKDVELESLRLGAMDFLTKPYNMPDIILARVDRLIEFVEDRQIIQDVEYDPLTGLYRRNFFYEYGRRLISAERGRTFDLLAFDIDRFRIVNELYGKAFGDQVLCAVADGIRDILKEHVGIACRSEADRFYVLLEHEADYRHLIGLINAHVKSVEHQSIIRTRLGVFEKAGTNKSIEWYSEAAGSACDAIRDNYQTDFMLYDEGLHAKELYYERLIADVDEALQNGQFRVYYQPKYAIQGTRPRLVSAEALIRWQHPEFEFISPGEFIPLFEKNGLILKLDQYVWREAASQIRKWKDQYGIDLHVSVNVSRKDLFDVNLKDQMLGIVQRNGISCKDLILEVTESAYAQDTGQMIEAVEQLRAAGFQIEMDDFGTGYSSLNMLCALPIDALKIDMSFVRNIVKNRTEYSMFKLIFEMAGVLKVPTIVEGVEEEAQYQLVREVGCDIVQGYYFSRPVDTVSFEKLIQAELEQAGS